MDRMIDELPLDDAVQCDGSDAMCAEPEAPISALARGEDVAPGATSSAQAETVDIFESAVRDFCKAVEPGLRAAEQAFEKAMSQRPNNADHYLVIAYRMWLAAQRDREGFNHVAEHHEVRFTAHTRRPFNEVLQVLHRASGLPTKVRDFAARNGRRLERMHEILHDANACDRESLPCDPSDDQIIDALNTVLGDERASKKGDGRASKKAKATIKSKSATATASSERYDDAASSANEAHRGAEPVDVVLDKVDGSALADAAGQVSVALDADPGEQIGLRSERTVECERSESDTFAAVPQSSASSETAIEDQNPIALIKALSGAVEEMIRAYDGVEAVAAAIEKATADEKQIAPARDALIDLRKVNRILVCIRNKYLQA